MTATKELSETIQNLRTGQLIQLGDQVQRISHLFYTQFRGLVDSAEVCLPGDGGRTIDLLDETWSLVPASESIAVGKYVREVETGVSAVTFFQGRATGVAVFDSTSERDLWIAERERHLGRSPIGHLYKIEAR